MIDIKKVEHLVKLLKEKGFHISACESCTGGMFISSIIDVSGSSAVVNESYITYSNEAKERLLGVSSKTLETYGAVSSETAFEMAKGLYEKIDTDVAVSITGLAGPDGGTIEKPVGLCFIGINIKGNIKVFKINNSGTRFEIREKTVLYCIDELITLLEEL